MAKLSARGRTIVMSFVKERNVTDPERSIDWERTTYALMSDGHLLKKRDVRFKECGTLSAYKYSYGWKDEGKIKTSQESVRGLLLSKGYTEEGS